MFVSIPDARVYDQIHDVGGEVDEDEGESDGEYAALEKRLVAVGDGGDGEASDAGPAEDGFGDDGPGVERSELQAEEGDDGNERVAQGMLIDDGALGQALGASGADVVLAEFFE